jgi:hypothetical protein
VDDSAFFLDCLTFKIKASLSFETLWGTFPVTKHHIQEGLTFHFHLVLLSHRIVSRLKFQSDGSAGRWLWIWYSWRIRNVPRFQLPVYSFPAFPADSMACAMWSELKGAVSIMHFYSGSFTNSLINIYHYATNQKVAGLIPDGVIGIFHWHNSSGCTLVLGSTQPLTEISTRNISWG